MCIVCQSLLHWCRLSAVAQTTLKDIRMQTRAGLEHALTTRNILDVNVTLQAPYLLVPFGGKYSKLVKWGLIVVNHRGHKIIGDTKSQGTQNHRGHKIIGDTKSQGTQNHRGHKITGEQIFFTVSEIHYYQLKFHRTFYWIT